MRRSGIDADVLVAGGGPSGLAAAIAATQRGLSALVIEPRRGVIDKACGEGLMPAAVDALERLGVALPTGRPFVGIRYVDATRTDLCADGDFPGRAGRGVRRTALHAALLERAQAAGVRIVHERVRAVRQTGHAVQANGLRGRWLVAADGLHSPIRRTLGLCLPARLPPRYGARRHFRARPWSNRVEVHWSRGAEAYVTPVGPETVGLALLFEHGGRFGPLLERHFPNLHDRLGPPLSDVRGAGPFEQRVRRRVAGRVLLVGDAAGYLDALTGEGVALGVNTARAAIACIAAGRPQAYESRWRDLTGAYLALTHALLWATRRVSKRRPGDVVRIARASPWLFDGVLGVLGR